KLPLGGDQFRPHRQALGRMRLQGRLFLSIMIAAGQASTTVDNAAEPAGMPGSVTRQAPVVRNQS
ncbi:MAG: hypothetical protein MUO63_14360, partial [Desulfobulbaceae bacterium]|nr:hypothetical protein [Desulfobulbaceae bacterium]